MPAEPIIRVEHLTKVYRNFDRREGLSGAVLDLFRRRYREIRAVDDVSFSITPGEMVGYIGANGAGKSTTIKMLVGILTPTAGTMRVNKLVPQKNRYAHARQIGVVFGQRTQLWWDLAVVEAFHLLQKIYRIPYTEYRARLEHFTEVLDIGGQLHQPVRKLSLGQRMKCDLCASLLHRPPLLFLDEPTIGLDVAVKERIRRFIRQINRDEGATVILTTHDLIDIEELCPRIIIIDQGRILFDGATQQIKERFGRRRRVVLDLKRDYLPQYRARPLPGPEVPIAFAGLDSRQTGRPAEDGRGGADETQDSLAPGTGSGSVGKRGGGELGRTGGSLAPPTEAIELAPLGPPAGEQRPQAPPAQPLNTLDEPGARQFMAELAAVMGDGTYLKVRRLNPRQYQLSFDRRRYSASEVISLLIDRYDVADLSLHEPELADIVRAIYEGKHEL